jgi:hypothetical protein
MSFPKKCLDCAAEVAFDGTDMEYQGFGPCKKHPGNHVVEAVTYYHPGARDIQDIRDRRKFSPVIHLVPVYHRIDPKTGNSIQTKGLQVQFGDGKLDTADPQIQFYLEQKPDIAFGEGGLKMWREIYLNPQQNLDIAKAELADTQRQIRESNELLAQVKANTKAGKQASV